MANTTATQAVDDFEAATALILDQQTVDPEEETLEADAEEQVTEEDAADEAEAEDAEADEDDAEDAEDDEDDEETEVDQEPATTLHTVKVASLSFPFTTRCCLR